MELVTNVIGDTPKLEDSLIRVQFLWKNSDLNLNLISNLINFGFLNQIETKTKLDKCRLYEYRVYNNLVFQTILFINHGFS